MTARLGRATKLPYTTGDAKYIHPLPKLWSQSVPAEEVRHETLVPYHNSNLPPKHKDPMPHLPCMTMSRSSSVLWTDSFLVKFSVMRSRGSGAGAWGNTSRTTTLIYYDASEEAPAGRKLIYWHYWIEWPAFHPDSIVDCLPPVCQLPFRCWSKATEVRSSRPQTNCESRSRVLSIHRLMLKVFLQLASCHGGLLTITMPLFVAPKSRMPLHQYDIPGSQKFLQLAAFDFALTARRVFSFVATR